MKTFLVIFYSKSIDGTVLIQVKANTSKNIIDVALKKLYTKQFKEHRSKNYRGTFSEYLESCLQNDGLHHVVTIQEPKRIVSANYFPI